MKEKQKNWCKLVLYLALKSETVSSIKIEKQEEKTRSYFFIEMTHLLDWTTFKEANLPFLAHKLSMRSNYGISRMHLTKQLDKMLDRRAIYFISSMTDDDEDGFDFIAIMNYIIAFLSNLKALIFRINKYY